MWNDGHSTGTNLARVEEATWSLSLGQNGYGDDDDDDDDGGGFVFGPFTPTHFERCLAGFRLFVCVFRVMMMRMMMMNGDDSHDGYTVVGINYHHATHRSPTLSVH